MTCYKFKGNRIYKIGLKNMYNNGLKYDSIFIMKF